MPRFTAPTKRDRIKEREAKSPRGEIARDAALAQRIPTLGVDANYGDIGTNLANSHGSFAVTGSLKFNIYTGGRIRADVEQADAIIKQRKDEYG